MRMQVKLSAIMTRALAGLVLLFIVCGFSRPALAHESCKGNPPSQAAITEDHGYFFFIYPRVIIHSFTGCQTMWDEKGNRLFVLTFESGSLTHALIHKSDIDGQLMKKQFTFKDLQRAL